jgi:hypothetical protein
MTASLIRDVPRIGPLLWLLLSAFLLPPAFVAFIGAVTYPLPHQTLWVILLGCPIPFILLSLPKEYQLDEKTLHIRGWLYHLSIAREEILSVQRISAWKALTNPRSMYCSDPAKALLITYSGKTGKRPKSLVISPHDPVPIFSFKT